MTILLASGSPRRRELLGRLGVPFEVVPSHVEERAPHPGETPEQYVRALARLKADDVASRHPKRVVLGADTEVAIEGRILGKPEDEEDAVRMLTRLAGRTHIVVTAVAVRGCCHGEGAERAEVQMRQVTEETIRAYVATGEPMDKAGAYAVQGQGGRLVESVRGCYDTVVGLPLCVVASILAECRVAIPIAPSCRHLS